jgi:hypothetical protein
MEGPQSDRALLIAGPVAGSGAARPSLAPLAEALRAGGRPPAVDQVDAPTSAAALTRAVEATARAPGVAWVVCVGAVQVGTDGLALDIGGDAWPLALFGDAGAARSVAIAIIDAHPDVTSEAVLAALGDRGLRIAIVGERTAARRRSTALVAAPARRRARSCTAAAVTAASLAALPRTRRSPDAARSRCRRRRPRGDRPVRAAIGSSACGASAGRSPRAALPRAADGDDPELGTILPGRFRLDARLAEGGFGLVYRARQLTRSAGTSRSRSCAPGSTPFSEDGRLFVQEIQAVGRIDHAERGARLPGRRHRRRSAVLRDGAPRGPRPAGPGRGRAHRRSPTRSRWWASSSPASTPRTSAGLVHADVKPGNVIVSGGRAVLVDFGLARLRRTDEAADRRSAARRPTWRPSSSPHEPRRRALRPVRRGPGAGRAGHRLAPHPRPPTWCRPPDDPGAHRRTPACATPLDARPGARAGRALRDSPPPSPPR